MIGHRLISTLLAFVLSAAAAQAQSYDDLSSTDVIEADARIHQIMTAGDAGRYPEAASLYLSLLYRLDAEASAAESDVLLKHLRAAAVVLPQTLRNKLHVDEALQERRLARLSAGAGDHLVRWWRQQDPLPATENNERLEAHLARVSYALRTFGRPEDPRGFDDRGEIYIRFGDAGQRDVIEVNPAMLAFDHRNVAPAAPLPDNEVWTYRHVADDVVYVFVRRTPNEPYRLGGAADLISSELRNGFIRDRSGPDKARLVLDVLEEIYAQLALLHPLFGTIYDEVASAQALPPLTSGSPVGFIQRALVHAQTEDAAVAWRRERSAPGSYFRAHGLAEPLSFPLRWARFLEPDGTTRTEVYWSLPMEEARPSDRLVRRLTRQGHEPSDQYLLTASLLHLGPDYARRDLNVRHFLAPAETTGILDARTLTAHGDTGLYHLALQWDQRWTLSDENGALQPGARLKVGTARIDSLDALSADEGRLELSDLKLLVRSPERETGQYMPYPFESLPPEPSITLYFEVYHLAFGADDRTRYTIECEVSRQAEKSLIPFLSRSAETASVRAVNSGAERSARERIELDLSAWEGDLEITVRVRDDITGEERTRAITFSSNR